jgi:hypothetical protein
MEPVSLLAVGLSSLFAVSAKSLVGFFSRKFGSEHHADINVVTKEGSEVRVVGADKLTDKEVQDIVKTLEIADSSHARTETKSPPNTGPQADG